ncbi:hypothetical protein ABID29_000704 [Streptococcus rupicaprae]|uniref:MFS transporter n=1 Tax=Streptococcus rupicaprae TaxID=759619 RepID=A0ABV2FGD7_9STRE
MRKIISNRLYMTVFSVDMLSNFGDTVYYLALMDYVLRLKETQLALSLVTLSETIPIFTLLFAGVWADKTKNKVDTIIATQWIRALLYLVVGLVMGFQPSLWIVIVASLINTISDIAGQYEGMLYIPLSLRIVPDEDRQAMFGFSRSVNAALSVVFRSSGALLIGFLSYQNLALFNAGTFLVCSLVMLSLKMTFLKLLEEQPLEAPTPRQGILKDTKESLALAYQALAKYPFLKLVVQLLALGNGLGTATTSLSVLMLKENPASIMISPAMTLSIIVIFKLLGNILGSLLTGPISKKISMINLLRISLFSTLLLYLSYFIVNVYGVVLFSFLGAVAAGAFQPKMSALFYRLIPENHLATVGAGVDTLCYLGMVASQVLVAGVLLIRGTSEISLLYALLSVLVLAYTSRKKVDLPDRSEEEKGHEINL